MSAYKPIDQQNEKNIAVGYIDPIRLENINTDALIEPPKVKDYQLNSLFVIQNADVNAHVKDYAHLKEDELLVHGIFCTIQGEGPLVGTPCVFLRLAGCNLGSKQDGFCAFCDTDFKLKDGKIMSFSKIADNIQGAWRNSVKGPANPLLIITGGEPGLQPNIVKFILYMTLSGWKVQVETNGTQKKFALDFNNCQFKDAMLVVSPKAGKAGYGMINPDLWGIGDNVLKLIVDHRPESPHHIIPQFAFDWQNIQGSDKVYLSPIAVYAKEYKGEISDAWQEGLLNKELTRLNYNFAATKALELGFKLSIQQHLFCAVA